MINKEQSIDLIGYGGGFLSLAAYFLITNNFILSDSMIYLLMNIIAGISLMIYTFTKKAYANTILNSVWSLITIIAILRAAIF
jgi:hypothetical protein